MARKGLANKMKRSGKLRTSARPRKRNLDELIEFADSSEDETVQPQKRARPIAQDIAMPAKQQERNRELEELLFGPPEVPTPAKEPAHPPQPPMFTLFLSFPQEIRDMIYRYTLESDAMSASLRQPSLSKLTSKLNGLDDFLQHQLNLAGCSHRKQQKAWSYRDLRRSMINQQIKELPPLLDLSLFYVNKQVSQEAMSIFYAHTLVRLKVGDDELTNRDKEILRQACHLDIKYKCNDYQVLRASWGPSLRQILEPRTNVRSFTFQAGVNYRLTWPGVRRVLNGLPRIAVKKGPTIAWLYEDTIEYLTSYESRWEGRWKEYCNIITMLGWRLQ